MQTQVDANQQRHCALCKYWYDPGSLVLTPVNGAPNCYSFDTKVKNACSKNGNMQTPAIHSCSSFSRKQV